MHRFILLIKAGEKLKYDSLSTLEDMEIDVDEAHWKCNICTTD